MQAARDARLRARGLVRDAVRLRERNAQADLLRQLVGNPYMPQSVRQHVPEPGQKTRMRGVVGAAVQHVKSGGCGAVLGLVSDHKIGLDQILGEVAGIGE